MRSILIKKGRKLCHADSFSGHPHALRARMHVRIIGKGLKAGALALFTYSSSLSIVIPVYVSFIEITYVWGANARPTICEI